MNLTRKLFQIAIPRIALQSTVAVGLFSASGTLGIAIGPIIFMLLLANLGLSFTP